MDEPLPIIQETPTFTRLVYKYLEEESYRLLQWALATHPEAGKLISGGGGIRKIRWAAKGHGKRGGVRVIYYWANRQGIILMIYIYAKNEASDLTPEQIRTIRKFVEKLFPK